ncbi:MAG: aminotransferase class V-fold PLP-dependent enzyme, partial [Candidatus Binataceae bacterium]
MFAKLLNSTRSTMQIYLDHNAGTPMRPAVREALAEFLAREAGGNPASVHRAGQRARRELERARDQIANLIGAPARSIIFTSGGTEANNLAIDGAAHTSGRRQIVTTAIEHSSVLAPLSELESRGHQPRHRAQSATQPRALRGT